MWRAAQVGSIEVSVDIAHTRIVDVVGEPDVASGSEVPLHTGEGA
jgi:hypothetical protein